MGGHALFLKSADMRARPKQESRTPVARGAGCQAQAERLEGHAIKNGAPPSRIDRQSGAESPTEWHVA
jgi:hypothetical protein